MLLLHSYCSSTNRCKFTGTIIDQFANAHMASQRGDRRDVSSFVLDHFGQKRFCGLLAMTTCYYRVFLCVCLCVLIQHTQKCAITFTLNERSIRWSGVSNRCRPDTTPALFISSVTCTREIEREKES